MDKKDLTHNRPVVVLYDDFLAVMREAGQYLDSLQAVIIEGEKRLEQMRSNSPKDFVAATTLIREEFFTILDQEIPNNIEILSDSEVELLLGLHDMHEEDIALAKALAYAEALDIDTGAIKAAAGVLELDHPFLKRPKSASSALDSLLGASGASGAKPS